MALIWFQSNAMTNTLLRDAYPVIKIFPCWILWESPLICQIMVVNLFVYLDFLKCSAALQFLVFTPWEFVVKLNCRSYIELSTRLVRIIWVRVQRKSYILSHFLWDMNQKVTLIYFPYSSLPEFLHQPLNISSG